MLEIKNLFKDFDGFEVLRKLNWTVNTGSITGLIGSNGAGKSTLLRCVSNVYDYPKGEIEFNGVSTKVDRSDLFFVSDEPFYFNRFTTKDMLDFYACFYKNLDVELYKRLLDIFDFDDDVAINRLSRGLKRQSALILGLSTRPKLLLMDESFDGLDPQTRLTLKRELIRAVTEDNMTIIISSHNIRELEDICDYMALLTNGKIAFDKSVEELNNEYHKVQLGYKDNPDLSVFSKLPLLSLEVNNKVITVIYKDEAVMRAIEETKPSLINPLSISLEEIFVSEMEAKNAKEK